ARVRHAALAAARFLRVVGTTGHPQVVALDLAAALGARLARRARWGVRLPQPRPHGPLRRRGAAARLALLLRDGHEPAREVGRDDRDGRRVPRGRARVEASATVVRYTRPLIVAGLVLVLGAVNWSIWGKERIKASGAVVYLDLAPLDPRSIMQGDY